MENKVKTISAKEKLAVKTKVAAVYFEEEHLYSNSKEGEMILLITLHL